MCVCVGDSRNECNSDPVHYVKSERRERKGRRESKGMERGTPKSNENQRKQANHGKRRRRRRTETGSTDETFTFFQPKHHKDAPLTISLVMIMT